MKEGTNRDVVVVSSLESTPESHMLAVLFEASKNAIRYHCGSSQSLLGIQNYSKNAIELI